MIKSAHETIINGLAANWDDKIHQDFTKSICREMMRGFLDYDDFKFMIQECIRIQVAHDRGIK